MSGPFRTSFSEEIFRRKYAHEGAHTWNRLAYTVANDVCGGLLPPDEINEIAWVISEMWFIPGGRYLYYAGRPNKFFNNCYIFKSEEDSREDWAMTSWKHESALMTGGGTGNDYSVYRPEGSKIHRTGGVASGPIPKMEMTNEIGRRVMQGGSRRSAIYASLAWNHQDIMQFLHVKDWDNQVVAGTGGLSVGDLKRADFNYHAPLDMTNISPNYLTDWLLGYRETGDVGEVFRENMLMAMRTGEPGFSFNFFEKERETGRNACNEVTSEDDSDVCNLGSVNMSRIRTLEQFERAVIAGTKFLVCGTLKAKLPFEKVYKVREKNRRLGLGLMGVHEWLLARGYQYGMVPQLQDWLTVYRAASDKTADSLCDQLGISRPVAKRAIAPTGTIGIMAGTTTGIEPIFATAYKRRSLRNGTQWVYEYVIDGTAQVLIDQYSIDPDQIETALDLAEDPERRIKFQYEVQKFVDQAISSTLNLPGWGTELNNEDRVDEMAQIVAKYAHGLRGLTFYPDGARGGQPLTVMPYREVVGKTGVEHTEEFVDVCSITGKGGTCGS